MRIYKREKICYLDFIHKGRRFRRAVGRNKKTAEIALKEVELKIFKGEFLGVEEEKHVLFDDFAKEYLEYSQANKALQSFKCDMEHIYALFNSYLDIRISK